MALYLSPTIPLEVYAARRRNLLQRLPGKAIVLGNGSWRFKSIDAVRYPFRSSSHVLYFSPALPPDAMLLMTDGETSVFLPERSSDDEIWHGPTPDDESLKQQLGVNRVSTHCELRALLKKFAPTDVLSLPSVDSLSNALVSELVGRNPDLDGADRELALAIVDLRLTHDSYAIRELRAAAEMTADSFLGAMRMTAPGKYQFELLAEMDAATRRSGGEPAFLGMATNRCEVLHDDADPYTLFGVDDMVLADFGAETKLGYSSDVTRTWPVCGVFTPEQRAIYEIVLAAQATAIAAVQPGRRFLDVHFAAVRRLTEGLVEVGILKGEVDALVERGAHTLFFPHGIGHLVGLDVHDMEDLGDLAGYAPGRSRAEEFGLNFLRLDRDLVSGMAVSIEPGCYFIPALLDDTQRMAPYSDCICRERLAVYRTLRGIRIEDTVLVTEDGVEVLTEAIPKSCDAVENLVGTDVRE